MVAFKFNLLALFVDLEPAAQNHVAGALVFIIVVQMNFHQGNDHNLGCGKNPRLP